RGGALLRPRRRHHRARRAGGIPRRVPAAAVLLLLRDLSQLPAACRDKLPRSQLPDHPARPMNALLDKLKDFFSKSFVLSSFLPVLVCAAVNAALLYETSPRFRAFAETQQP